MTYVIQNQYASVLFDSWYSCQSNDTRSTWPSKMWTTSPSHRKVAVGGILSGTSTSSISRICCESRGLSNDSISPAHRGTNEAAHRGRILELHLQDFTTIKILRNAQFTSIHITWALDMNSSKVIQKFLTSHDPSHIRFTSLAVDPTCSSPSMPAIFKPRLAARFARLRVVSPSPKQPSAAAVVPQWYGRRRARCNWKHLQWIWFQGSKVQAGQNPQKSRWGLQKKPPTDED